jgi:hypothetical protein
MNLFAALLMLLSQEPQPESRILTYKDYAKIKHDVPYILEFTVGKGALLLYGGRHVFDPADAQVADIQNEWAEFKPDVVYNEGGNPPTEASVGGAVKRYGEPGLVRFLAARDHVPIATFEPKEDEEVAALRKRFSAEQVKVFLALRSFLTFRHSHHDQTVERYMDHALTVFGQEKGLAESPRNYQELQESCNRLLPELKDWRQVPDDWFDPTQEGHYTNEAQNVSGYCRDRHIFKVLIQSAQRGNRVLAVIGASHVLVLEPALVAALGPPCRKRNGNSLTPSK